MKKLLVALLVFPVAVMAQDGFEITGSIAGLPENSRITLTNLNNQSDTVARAMVTNGNFILKGKVVEPNLYQLNMEGVAKKTLLFLGNDKMTIKGSHENAQQMDVKGSTSHQDFVEMQNIFNPLMQKLIEINKKIQSTPGLDRNDSIFKSYQKTYDQVVATIDRFVKEKKSSQLSAFLMVITRELEQNPENLVRRFDMLDVTVQKGFYGRILQEEVDKAKFGAVGTEALPFTQGDTTGKPVSLTSFRGKYVLVDFWASWCKPCRVENPNLVAAFKKFKNKNFTVLGVSLDRSREPWIQAIKEDNLTWTQVSDLRYWQNEVAQMYKIESIPQNYLVGPDGKIVGKNLRGEALEAKLCELLGCE
jgi:peroxiredoxin